MVQCPNCGAQVGQGDSFCQSCGTALAQPQGGQAQGGQPQAGQPQGGPAQQGQYQGQGRGQQPPAQQAPQGQPPQAGGTSRRQLLAYGGGAAAILAAAGGGWWFLTQGGGGSISYGQTVNGQISSGGPRDPFYNDLCATHTFQGSAGDDVRIRMESEIFDTYLILTDGNENRVAENDDAGFSLNSEIVTRLPSDGTYTIWAGSFSGEATGSYTLTLERA